MARTLDCKGLFCPEPVLRTHTAMRRVRAGQTLTVFATDPAAVLDFDYYCHKAGLELLSMTRQRGLLIFEIRKPSGKRPRKRRHAGAYGF